MTHNDGLGALPGPHARRKGFPMAKKNEKVIWNDKVQSRLTAIRAAKENDTAREAELIRTRKELEGRLRELGALDVRGLRKKMVDAGIAEKKADILLTRNELVVTYFGLKFVRDHYKMLCDKMDATIDDANQGKLAFAEGDLDDEDLHAGEPSEAELFSKPEPKDDEDPDQQRLPVGQAMGAARGKEPNSEERARNDGYVGDGAAPAGLDADIRDLDLPDRIAKHLYAANLTTIGKLIEFGEQHGNQYTGVDGVSQAASDGIHHTLKKWRRIHRAAQTEKELAGA